MSSQVTVLQAGYSKWKQKPHIMYANGSTSLVRSGRKVFLVDTLGPWDRDRLCQLLKKQGLHPDDIPIVIGTHLHTDHIGNLNLFTKSVQFVGDTKSSKPDLFEFDVFGSSDHIGGPHFSLTNDVELYSTPGHTECDVSLVVHNVDRRGTVAIVGDLFECEQDIENEALWMDAGSFNLETQRKNRKMILSLADYIVPGHGDMFKVPN